MTYAHRILVVIVAILAAESAMADSDWYRYESEHFIVFSDDSRWVTKKAIRHLELFRAAVNQFAHIQVPADAPKVRVVIMSSHVELHKLIGNYWSIGTDVEINGIPHIITGGSGKSRELRWFLNHLYSHVALTYKNYDYPTWFVEGFAELMQPTEFKNRNRTFTVGNYRGRGLGGGLLTAWEDLLDPDFDINSLEYENKRSAIFTQCWIMTYYFVIDDEFGNLVKLQKYLNLLSGGQDSVTAMETALGEPVDQWAGKLWREYSYQVQDYYAFNLQEPVPDVEISERVPVPESELEPVFDAVRGSGKPAGPENN